MVAGTYQRLYLALDAQLKPSAPALKRALTEDPQAGEVLYRRLNAYPKHDLPNLSPLQSLPMGRRLYRPKDLAVRGHEFWGDWKQMWPVANVTPERVSLLTRAGVACDLTAELSRGFFEWLQDQREAVWRKHLPQVFRHLLDPKHGPLQWWSAWPTIGCLPVERSGDAIELVSYAAATGRHSAVYLPDFHDLRRQVLERDPGLCLVITYWPGIDGTLFDPLATRAVKSLRKAVGSSITIEPSGEEERGDATFDALLQSLRSQRMAGELPNRLGLHQVRERLRSEWRDLLGRLIAVRIAAGLIARYEFRNVQYAVPVNAAVEPDTGIVWLRANSDRMMAFYEALTSYLFDDNYGPPPAYGFRLAVERPFDPGPARGNPVSAPRAMAKASQAGGNRDGSIETPKPSHGIRGEDTVRSVPDPRSFELSPITLQLDSGEKTGRSGRGAEKSNGSSRSRRSNRPAATDLLRNTREEQEQIRQLKEKHYAWHCQACLGAYNVTVAVPPNSYLTLDRDRREFVEAHHVDHLHNQGVLGARNLLLLCRFHHHALGDRLTRRLVVEALQNGSAAQRRFPIDPDCITFKDLPGTIATVRLDTAPFEIRLFFTGEHARAWLDASQSDFAAPAQAIVSTRTPRRRGARPEAAEPRPEPSDRQPRAGTAGDSWGAR
jgi:hypothetical protein